MQTINLRYQVSLFGNYAEIIPNSENMKFFIDNFSDKGMIPNQYQEVRVHINFKEATPTSKSNERIQLTDPEKKWEIKFNTDRIDILFLNSNIGVTEIISKEKFLSEVVDFLNRINQKFQKQHKRVGFVTQYLFENVDVSKTSGIFINAIDYFKEKPIIDWSNKIATRAKLLYGDNQEELVNINSEARWISSSMIINSNVSSVSGVFLSLDVNTVPENSDYRFQSDNLELLLGEILKIENEVFDQTIAKS
jgi:hypothetical protein